jgi:hypothetical protein
MQLAPFASQPVDAGVAQQFPAMQAAMRRAGFRVAAAEHAAVVQHDGWFGYRGFDLGDGNRGIGDLDFEFERTDLNDLPRGQPRFLHRLAMSNVPLVESQSRSSPGRYSTAMNG